MFELPFGCYVLNIATGNSIVLIKYDCVRGLQQTLRCRRIVIIMSGNYLGPGIDVWVGIELNNNYKGVYIQVSRWNINVRQKPPGARPNAASCQGWET